MTTGAELPPGYPLKWPANRPRMHPMKRRAAKFKQDSGTKPHRDMRPLTVAEAIARLDTELDRTGARYLVVTSNVELRLNGLPRSGMPEPADPGVAVYFVLGKELHCLPCDTYNRIADNIAAVAAHVEATRAIERHGVATVAEMFAGFKLLTSPDRQRPWREVLELHNRDLIRPDDVRQAYQRLAFARHPDHGGSDAMMAELNRARDDARRELTP